MPKPQHPVTRVLKNAIHGKQRSIDNCPKTDSSYAAAAVGFKRSVFKRNQYSSCRLSESSPSLAMSGRCSPVPPRAGYGIVVPDLLPGGSEKRGLPPNPINTPESRAIVSVYGDNSTVEVYHPPTSRRPPDLGECTVSEIARRNEAGWLLKRVRSYFRSWRHRKRLGDFPHKPQKSLINVLVAGRGFEPPTSGL